MTAVIVSFSVLVILGFMGTYTKITAIIGLCAAATLITGLSRLKEKQQ